MANKFDLEVLEHFNALRKDPLFLIPHLEELRECFDEKFPKRLNWPTGAPQLTHEGVAGIDALITYLQNVTPVEPCYRFRWEPMLRRACKDHVKDQGGKGRTGHKGTDGSAPFQRMARYGTLTGKSAENVIYGDRTPFDCMMQSAIDDGIRSRAHLVNFFNPALVHFACYTGDHKTFQKVTVAVFAESFIPMDRTLKTAVIDKGDLEMFMKTAIEFDEPPDEAKSWRTST